MDSTAVSLSSTSALSSSEDFLVSSSLSSTSSLVVGSPLLRVASSSTWEYMVSEVWFVLIVLTSSWVISCGPLTILALDDFKCPVGLCPGQVRIAAVALFLSAEALSCTGRFRLSLSIVLDLSFDLPRRQIERKEKSYWASYLISSLSLASIVASCWRSARTRSASTAILAWSP